MIRFLSCNRVLLNISFQCHGNLIRVSDHAFPLWATTDQISATVEALRSMLIVKCLWPDRLLQSTALFVRDMFQSDLSSDLDHTFTGCPVIGVSYPSSI
jgi:hypothetical protein